VPDGLLLGPGRTRPISSVGACNYNLRPDGSRIAFERHAGLLAHRSSYTVERTAVEDAGVLPDVLEPRSWWTCPNA
jgi:hypothetical protein